MPFSGENIGRWSGYYGSSKSFNSGCNGRAGGRVKTQMPFYALGHREHQHPFSNARIPPLEGAMWLKSQECWGLNAGLLKNGFECKSTLLRIAKGCSQAKVASFSFIILEDPKIDMGVRQFLVSDKRI